MQDDIKEFIQRLNSQYVEIAGGCYADTSTGEILTPTEVKKIMQHKIEEYNMKVMNYSRNECVKNGIEVDQFISNKRSKVNKSKKIKDRFDGGDFNMVYRKKVGEGEVVKLNATEKGVWYSLGELCTYPTNTVMIQGEIPNIEQLGSYVGMSVRQLRRYLRKLKEVNLIQEKQVGYKKAFILNPEYYATGKDLDIDTLKMFELVEFDNEKVKPYMES